MTRRIRVDVNAGFLVTAIVDTEATAAEVAEYSHEKLMRLIWEALQEDWDNTGIKLRDAEITPLEVCELNPDDGEALDNTVTEFKEVKHG